MEDSCYRPGHTKIMPQPPLSSWLFRGPWRGFEIGSSFGVLGGNGEVRAAPGHRLHDSHTFLWGPATNHLLVSRGFEFRGHVNCLTVVGI